MRKHWGWGTQAQALTVQQLRDAAPAVVEFLGFGSLDPELPVPLAQARMPEPRITVAPLADMSATDPHARATHTLGKAYRDIIRGFRGDFRSAPDAVLTPATETDIERALEWADARGVAVIPYGGGTSVVGGIEPRGLDAYNGVVSLDLGRMNALLEVDEISGSAHLQAGASGPTVEKTLAAHGLTARFFPQSFEFSTVGGWIATRAGGHFASGPTHIDDVVESIRALSPAGEWESRRLPASGAGPSPDRLLLGSEGALAVITSAWLRVQRRPDVKRSASVRFPSFDAGCDAIRAILQAGMRPSNCRLIDALEAPGDDSRPLLILGFEADFETQPLLDAALDRCRQHGGQTVGNGESEWRGAFLQAPYLRDTLVSLGVLAETFETATTWQRLPALIDAVSAVIEGRVTCRLTHVYPDGAAAYFTVLLPVTRGEEVETWDEIKSRVSTVLVDHDATITHHHAVGRDHAPWYQRQRPDLFGEALSAVKRVTDPRGILNPGVLGLTG